MKENRFKEGDRVFDIRYGWGNVAESHIMFHIKVYFDSGKIAFWFDEISSRILSFTEYALDGYTAFRPEELPKKGDIVWASNHKSDWYITYFLEKDSIGGYKTTSHNPFDKNPSYLHWNYITTENPYANEQ